MREIILIEVTCPDRAVAMAIAEAALDRRLVACANIPGTVESLYRWHGAVERAEEVTLALKTRAELFEAVAEIVQALHPYETPAILALPVAAATEAARDWVFAETERAK